MNNQNFFTKKINIIIIAIICNALWGSAFPMIKIGYRMFEIPSDAVSVQILFAGIRFILAGVLTIAIGSVLNKKFLQVKKENIPSTIGLSLLQTVIQYVFFYIGLANTTGVKASIIEAINVFVALLISSFIFKFEPMSKKKILGCVIGFVGVVIINLGSGGMGGGFHLTGEGFIILSTISYGFSSVVIKYLSKREMPIALSGYQFLIGGAIMTVAGFALGGRINVSVEAVGVTGILLLIYLALISAVAYSLWGTLLKYNPVSQVAVYGFFNPVFGVLISAAVLGESGEAFGVKGIIALILVCIGIYVTNKKGAES